MSNTFITIKKKIISLFTLIYLRWKQHVETEASNSENKNLRDKDGKANKKLWLNNLRKKYSSQWIPNAWDRIALKETQLQSSSRLLLKKNCKKIFDKLFKRISHKNSQKKWKFCVNTPHDILDF